MLLGHGYFLSLQGLFASLMVNFMLEMSLVGLELIFMLLLLKVHNGLFEFVGKSVRSITAFGAI